MDILMVENICRICLQRQDTLFSLFRKIKGSSPYEKLVSKTQLKIEVNDAGPNSICSQCLIELDTTVNFLNKCENSNQVLFARLQIKEHSDVKPVTNAENYVALSAEDSLNIEAEAPDGLQEYKEYTGAGEKRVESGDDLERPRAPAAAEAARCAECGSLRRCRHWAPPATHTCQYCQKVFTRKFNFQLHL